MVHCFRSDRKHIRSFLAVIVHFFFYIYVYMHMGVTACACRGQRSTWMLLLKMTTIHCFERGSLAGTLDSMINSVCLVIEP